MSEEAERWNVYARQITEGGMTRHPNLHLALFQHYSIRRLWDAGQWWYSCVDCMLALSKTKDPSRYWVDLKKRMVEKEDTLIYDEGIVVIKKLPDKKGRLTPTDTANAEGLLRIIQSIMTPQVTPFKAWLAQVGAMVMDDIAEHARRVNHRTKLYQFDIELHEVAEAHGVVGRDEHYALDDANWSGLYGADINGELDLIRRRPGHLPGTLPETMGSAEMGANIFQRTMAAEMVKQHHLQGIGEIAGTAVDVGQHIRKTLASMGITMPEDMPQYPPLPLGEWMPLDHPSRINWDASAEIAGANDGGPDVTFIEIIAPNA